MKKVSEVAKILGVSKQAVHKKIKHPEFDDLIVKKGSVIYIKDEAISILRESTVNQNVNLVDEIDNSVDVLVDKKVDEIYERLINAKDETINKLTKQVDDLTRLLEQQQILMLNTQSELKLLQDNYDPTSLNVENKKKENWMARFFNRK